MTKIDIRYKTCYPAGWDSPHLKRHAECWKRTDFRMPWDHGQSGLLDDFSG